MPWSAGTRRRSRRTPSGARGSSGSRARRRHAGTCHRRPAASRRRPRPRRSRPARRGFATRGRLKARPYPPCRCKRSSALFARARALAGRGARRDPRDRRAARRRQVDGRARGRRRLGEPPPARADGRLPSRAGRSSCGSGGATAWARRTRSTPPATRRCCARLRGDEPRRLRARVPARDRGADRRRDRHPARRPARRHRGQLPAAVAGRQAAAGRGLVRRDRRGAARRSG